MYVYLTHFIAICFKEILVSAPLQWLDMAKTCGNYVKDCMHKITV